MQLGKDEYVYKTRGMNIFFGIKDKQMYATNDELLYKNVGKAADKSVKDAPYASDMKGKSLFIAINAEAILDLPIVKMVADIYRTGQQGFLPVHEFGRGSQRDRPLPERQRCKCPQTNCRLCQAICRHVINV